jgi:hypothetical protein
VAPAAPVTPQKRQVPVEVQPPATPAAPPSAEPVAPPPSLERRRANEAVSPPAAAAPAPSAQGALQSVPAAPAAVPESARAPMMREERSRPGALDEGSGRLSRDRALSDRPVGTAREAAPQRSPEAWLEDIRRLKAQGRDEEAAAELAEFRKRYPDYALPADLAR